MIDIAEEFELVGACVVIIQRNGEHDCSRYILRCGQQRAVFAERINQLLAIGSQPDRRCARRIECNRPSNAVIEAGHAGSIRVVGAPVDIQRPGVAIADKPGELNVIDENLVAASRCALLHLDAQLIACICRVDRPGFERHRFPLAIGWHRQRCRCEND